MDAPTQDPDEFLVRDERGHRLQAGALRHPFKARHVDRPDEVIGTLVHPCLDGADGVQHTQTGPERVGIGLQCGIDDRRDHLQNRPFSDPVGHRRDVQPALSRSLGLRDLDRAKRTRPPRGVRQSIADRYEVVQDMLAERLELAGRRRLGAPSAQRLLPRGEQVLFATCPLQQLPIAHLRFRGGERPERFPPAPGPSADLPAAPGSFHDRTTNRTATVGRHG